MELNEQRIKIAVQKTGRLTEHSLDLLERCGLKFTKSKDQLFCFGENMPIDLLLVRRREAPLDQRLRTERQLQAGLRTGLRSLPAVTCRAGGDGIQRA